MGDSSCCYCLSGSSNCRNTSTDPHTKPDIICGNNCKPKYYLMCGFGSAKTDDTITRLIIESDDWTLMFPGEIKNGKVNIPIRKLSLFEEGQRGKIKLEVIAEGTVFIPWEDEFKVKLSKKVTVSLNENKKIIPKKSELGVKVNVKK